MGIMYSEVCGIVRYVSNTPCKASRHASCDAAAPSSAGGGECGCECDDDSGGDDDGVRVGGCSAAPGEGGGGSSRIESLYRCTEAV